MMPLPTAFVKDAVVPLRYWFLRQPRHRASRGVDAVRVAFSLGQAAHRDRALGLPGAYRPFPESSDLTEREPVAVRCCDSNSKQGW